MRTTTFAFVLPALLFSSATVVTSVFTNTLPPPSALEALLHRTAKLPVNELETRTGGGGNPPPRKFKKKKRRTNHEPRKPEALDEVVPKRRGEHLSVFVPDSQSVDSSDQHPLHDTSQGRRAIKAHLKHGRAVHGDPLHVRSPGKKGEHRREPPPMDATSGVLPFEDKGTRKLRKVSSVKRGTLEEVDVAERDVEVRAATQYAYQASSQAYPVSSSWASSSSSSVLRSASTLTSSAPAASSSPSKSTSGYFIGASSYYIFSLADADRLTILDTLSSNGFATLRIFVASVAANNKGSDNIAVNDLEPQNVGTYDDTILGLIDTLMLECFNRGIKLIIALADRYALGFWSTDAYALQLNIVSPGSSGAQRVADASSFYTSSSAIQSFDNRLSHILNHVNPLMGGKTWAQLDSVIYAFEAQNEPQGHMQMASATWACDRAQHLRSLLPSSSSILISSGGGITLTASLGTWATSCTSIDVISVHDYGTSATSTVNALVAAAGGVASGKTVMLGEWGIAGANKAALVAQFVTALKAAGIPWMIWEVVKPGKAASDFEIWTDEPAWSALVGGSAPALTTVNTWSQQASTQVKQTRQRSASAMKTTAWSASPTTASPTNTWSPSPSSTTWSPQPTTTSWSQQAVNSPPKIWLPGLPAPSSKPGNTPTWVASTWSSDSN
ncbi:mannan endo-1,4-beta-mannosidase, partial [Phenoliferia sp. Uapishka_3]